MSGRIPGGAGRAGRGSAVVVAVLLALGLASSAIAEDVEKKFRIGLAVGGHDNRDAIESDSANNLLFTNQANVPVQIISDPRNDSAAIGEFRIEPATRVTLSAQYAVNKILMVEASVGYQKGDVGDIEVQAQFDGVLVPEELDFMFGFFEIDAGEMEQIPIQVTGLARFRPRSGFNPYFGGGFGYTVIGFEPSNEFNDLSVNLDASLGGFSQFQQSPQLGQGVFIAPDFIGDLEGATIDARDSFEWHLVAGAELTFKKKWVAFADLRYMFASRSLEIRFNGEQGVGVAVPNDILFVGDPLPPGGFGAIKITRGGLIDGGRLVPRPGAPAGTVCGPTNLGLCEFVFEPDGTLDTGLYYVQEGSLKYDGVSAHIGVRYTF